MTMTRWVFALMLASGIAPAQAADGGAPKPAETAKPAKAEAKAATKATTPAGKPAADKAPADKPAAKPAAAPAPAQAPAGKSAPPAPAQAPAGKPAAPAPAQAPAGKPAAPAPAAAAAPTAAGKPAAPAKAAAKPHAVPFTQVQVRDTFWAKRRDVNRKVTLQHVLDSVVRSGNLRYFELAARGERKGLSGPLTMDAELYGAIEAAAYSLAVDKDEVLANSADALISKVAAAQQPDGYLNTYYIVNAPDKRWTNLRDNHELDNVGHLIDAGLAYFQATGKRALLDVAIKAAGNLAATFGPGKRAGYPGHPGVESALVRLGQATGDHKLIDLARFFVDSRGRKLLAQDKPADKYTGVDWMDDAPVRDQQSLKGNVEGAVNLMIAAADLGSATGDAALLKTATRTWQNTAERRTFLTGGPGSSERKGTFTVDYDLPARTGHQGVCAAAAMIDLSQRLAVAHGDGRYADAMEAALYNVIAGAVAVDGKRFFGALPLASSSNLHRSDWFDENCGPIAAARMLAAVGGYAYAASEDALWVNLFVQGTVETTVGDQKVKLEVTTDYPWDGNIKIVVRPAKPGKFTLNVRIPAWATGATVAAAGGNVKTPPEHGYVAIPRIWKNGDQVRLTLPLNVMHIEANPAVKDARGRMAFQRGPIVYCLEAVDSPAAPLAQVAVPVDAVFHAEKKADLLGGVTVLKGAGRVDAGLDWAGRLYRTTDSWRPVPLTLVPYFVWDNRAPGAMEVWLPTSPPAVAAETRTPIAAPKPTAPPAKK